MLAAYSTLVLVILHYLFDYNGTDNSIDSAVIKNIPRLWNNKGRKPSKRWSKGLEAAVLMFSDQQIITGIAILISGYSQLPCGISIYHWQIVVDLAWFSSLTHLTTMTALRRFFHDRPDMAVWRVILMGSTIVLLGSALGPTGYVSIGSIERNSVAKIAVPAICLYSRIGYQEAVSSYSVDSIDNGNRLRPFNTLFIFLSLSFLWVSYATRAVTLFRHSTEFAKTWLRDKPGDQVKVYFIACFTKSKDSSTSRFKSLWSLLSRILFLAYVVGKATYDIGESMLWEVSVLALSNVSLTSLLKLSTRSSGSRQHWPGVVSA